MDCCLGEQTQSSNVNHCFLLLFKPENEMELDEEILKSQWNVLKGFNWEHSNSYMIRKSTDLFFHRVLFAKSNMSGSFVAYAFPNNCVFLQIQREHTLPDNCLVEQGHSFSSHKLWRNLFLNVIMADGEYIYIYIFFFF